MTDLICRKSMTRCQTSGMCAPHGGCREPQPLTPPMQVGAAYARAGIDFVCMPVLSETDRINLVNEAAARFIQVNDQAEAEEGV